jgi:hypothetical protein
MPNRSGTIARDEWHGLLGSFDRLDKNRDGRLTREEFSSTAPVATSGNRANQAGRERGLIEGPAAGREDRERNQGWDFAGQRELEQADSGYDAGMGARADYQAGSREAFPVGYREGFGTRTRSARWFLSGEGKPRFWRASLSCFGVCSRDYGLV